MEVLREIGNQGGLTFFYSQINEEVYRCIWNFLRMFYFKLFIPLNEKEV
jgi:hypothetical protein